MTLINYLEKLKDDKYFKTSFTINYLINFFKYRIERDFVINDLRTVLLHKKNENNDDYIEITAIFIYDKYYQKKEFVKIYYKNYEYEIIGNY